MKRFAILMLLVYLALAASFQACEDNASNPGGTNKPGIAVVVEPAATTLGTGWKQQFTAAFNGESGHQFVWSVAAGPGQISATGEYTAPAQLSLFSMSATIKAVLASDTSKVGYAQITIVGSNNGGNANPDTTGNGGGGNGGNGGGPIDTTVCFERDIQPILRSNCAMSGCHDAITHREGINLTSYESLMNSDEDDLVVAHRPSRSELYEVITEDDRSDRMPPPPRAALTSEQIALIRRWIMEGAQNRDCSKDGTPTCDLDNVTFSQTIQPILQNNCAGCHSGSAPSGGVLLTGYANVKKVADDGRLVGVTSHAPGFKTMPPGGKLTDCAIEQIKKWVQSGAPNN